MMMWKRIRITEMTRNAKNKDMDEDIEKDMDKNKDKDKIKDKKMLWHIIKAKL